LTRTIRRTSSRSQANGAENAPIDCATSVTSVAPPLRRDDRVGVRREPGLRVLGGQLDGDRSLAVPLEQRHHPVPVRRVAASAGYQDMGHVAVDPGRGADSSVAGR
jgi:hypothetical protein